MNPEPDSIILEIMDPDPQKMNVIAADLTPEAICEYVSVADP